VIDLIVHLTRTRGGWWEAFDPEGRLIGIEPRLASFRHIWNTRMHRGPHGPTLAGNERLGRALELYVYGGAPVYWCEK